MRAIAMGAPLPLDLLPARDIQRILWKIDGLTTEARIIRRDWDDLSPEMRDEDLREIKRLAYDLDKLTLRLLKGGER